MEECRLRVFEKKMQRRIFGPKRDEVTGSGEDCITKSFILCTPHQISFGCLSQEDRDGQDMWHVWGRGEVHTGL
jgi:hypothetical protein